MASHRQYRFIVAAIVCAAWVAVGEASSPAVGSAESATLSPETARAWEAYVDATEARIAGEETSGRGPLSWTSTADDARAARARAISGEIPVIEAQTRSNDGESLPISGGSITHWRGGVFVPNISLDKLLAQAQHPPEQGPFQADVLAVRVLSRRPNGLSLFIKMTRRTIVTVTYNTEHDVAYTRHSPTRASSRSVATKIAELETTANGERERQPGEDRGFLWRLNAYWRYEEVDGGVLVELESLSLSRDIPWGLGPIARPIANRIARESMSRTLAFFRQQMGASRRATFGASSDGRNLRQFQGARP